MSKHIVAAFFLLATCHISIAQEVGNYTLHVNKAGQEAANLHVECSFSVSFQKADSIFMNFGGGQEFSIDNLMINGDRVEYEYCWESKNLVIRKKDKQNVHIRMDYDYTNLSAFFIYGESDAELWETSYGEYFYPYMPNTYMDVDISVETPDSLSVLCSYPLGSNRTSKYRGNLQNILAHSLVLAFIRNNAYRSTSACLPEKVSVYQISGMQCDKDRYGDLLELTRASISYFSKIYGEDYISKDRNLYTFPTYLFHNGKGFSNRNNVGFISASQEKFSTYPNIYPLIHEIGHRWLGEWTLLIDDGEPGAYFIKETLNEFMTLMFIRHYYGCELYKSLIDKYCLEYEKIKGTPRDQPIADVVTNNNNTIIYYKGPLVLDRIAKEIGYDEMTGIISGFYRKYAGKYPLRYTDFINMVNERSAGAGDKLNHQLTANTL